MRVEELTHGDRPEAPDKPPHLSDGLHVVPWNSPEVHRQAAAWMALADAATTPNPFYEPWFLLPSLRHFDTAGDVQLALLVEGGRLVGLMPLWSSGRYYGRRLPHLAAWLHANAFCALPLVARGYELPFWRTLLAYADGNAGHALFLHLPQMPEDSPATQALRAACAETGRGCRIVRRESRALLRHGPTPDEHLEAAMSTKKRKELRRQRKRLAEEGSLDTHRLRNDEGLAGWIDRFLALEKAGWKGANGSALACAPQTGAMFREVLTGAAESSRLERLELTAGGAPVAMLATFLTPPGAFSFKTAFDESFSRFSPGVLLQLENLALLEDKTIAWCDSCAAADHPMIERIWRDRREVAWFTIPIGGRLRRAVGATLSAIEAHRSETPA